MRADMVKQYIKGLVWTMRYYYTAVPDWGWYYPYHHAPLMQDIYTRLADAPEQVCPGLGTAFFFVKELLASWAGGWQLADICRSLHGQHPFVLTGPSPIYHGDPWIHGGITCVWGGVQRPMAAGQLKQKA